MPPLPLTNFEIQKYYQNEARFNGVYSSDNLPNKIKDGSYVINLDEYSDIGTHWIALYALNNNITYFDSFGVEQQKRKRNQKFSKEIEEFIGNKNIQAKIFRIQTYDSLTCRYFCIGFTDFVLKDKSLTNFTNLFSPNDLKKMII